MSDLLLGRMVVRLVSAATVALGLLCGCLAIDQTPCTGGETLCVDGAVWACRGDGSGWDIEAICPGDRCEDGRCLLEPLPSFDATPVTDVPGPPNASSDVVD